MKATQIRYAIAAIILAAVCSVTVVVSQNAVSARAGQELVVIDTDAGSDDAVAIFYLLRAEKNSENQNVTKALKVVGITCVQGNTLVDNVVLNVLKVLNAVGRLDIPVYRGADKSLTVTPAGDNYYGMDGMGDVPSSFVPDPELLKTEHAVAALLRIVNENPGQITLLAFGPLTNVALAARLDGGFLKKLKKLVILGGSIAGRGNVKPGVEFNFFMDPEAVHIVFNGTDTNPNSISLVSWEAILTAKITWAWRKNVLGALQSTEALFINAIEHIEDQADEELWHPADPMAAAVFLEEAFIVGKMETYAITSVMAGPTRGGIAVDYNNRLGSATKADIVMVFNAKEFQDSLMKHFN